MADRQSFQLNREQWEAFVAALDAPPQRNPRLARFLQKPSVLEGVLRNSRLLEASAIAGIRVLAVHAIDEGARSFYEHFGFRPSPSDPLHLFVLLKVLQGIAGG